MANDIAEKEERLKRQLDFCLEIDKEKTIVRETYLADESRKETDAEHAWHMAVMAMVLSEYANKKVDTGRVIQMLLIHDLVEIYAGDTFAYDAAGAATQKTRETSGADRLFSKLPEDQGKTMRALWEEFEAWETPEAKFARSLDPVPADDAERGDGWPRLERARREGLAGDEAECPDARGIRSALGLAARALY